MIRFSTWFALAGVVTGACALIPSAADAQQSRHAALAIDRNDGERYGWAVDYPSRGEADARALAECGTRSVNCHVVLRFAEGCGAYVVERGNATLYGWGTSADRGAAEARARQEAWDRGGRNLVLRVWGCNSRAQRPDSTSEADRLRAELEEARRRRAQEAADADAAEQARLQRQLDEARQRREREAREATENGRLTGRVTDALTRAGIPGAAVLFEFGSIVRSVATDQDGAYTSPLVPDGTYRVTASREGYQAATLHGATVARTTTTTLSSIPLVPSSDQPGTISGTVRNARTAAAMPGVQVELRPGVGSTGGPPTATATSDGNGGYRFPDLLVGTYSVTASHPEFVAGGITGISVGGSDVREQDVLMSPEGTENEIRIVLSWGSQPRDLDSHLYGPDGRGGRFHVSYSGRGSLTGAPHAGLDVDDTSAHGPETVTIVRQSTGTYRYAVHHYGGSASIARSGAVVQVFRGATLLSRFEPPSGGSGVGDVWTVFELDGMNLRPINSIGRTLPD